MSYSWAWAGSSLALTPPFLSNHTDGKLYDAYVSHATAPDDRKFVHFIVKPQLENRYGYKLYLDEQNIMPNAGRHQPYGSRTMPSPGSGIPKGGEDTLGQGAKMLSLPGTEPSADLIMNVSRCRRLIVVLSVAYLEQDWCNSSFRYEPTPACLPLGERGWRLLISHPMPVSQGRALEVAGAFQETHLHRL